MGLSQMGWSRKFFGGIRRQRIFFFKTPPNAAEYFSDSPFFLIHYATF